MNPLVHLGTERERNLGLIYQSTVETLLSNPLREVKVRSDNRKIGKYAKNNRFKESWESGIDVGQLKIWIIESPKIEVLLYLQNWQLHNKKLLSH